jgi:hypothetical protein
VRRASSGLAVALCLLAAPALSQDRGRGRRDGAPAVGAAAPDFDLARLVDRAAQPRSGEHADPPETNAHADPAQRVRLAALRGRPVALIFGSYT